MPTPTSKPAEHPLWSNPQARPIRVLVIDDDPLQLRALQRQLRDHAEIELIICDNPLEGMLAVGAAKPDLVIMDVFMPDLDGTEACRQIKANPGTKDVEVVLTSAAMTPEIELAAQDVGARWAVSKPLDVAKLVTRMGGIVVGPEPTPLRAEIAVHGAPLAAAPVAPAPAGRLARGTTAPALVEQMAALAPQTAKHLPPPVAPGAPVAPTLRGADVLVQMLAEAGVEVVFGLPGGAISPVHDALMDSKIRHVTTRHESGAMFAAAAYARQTGKLGVVAVTSGPGVLNAMTGLASAWCDGLPVLLLVGEVPRNAQGKGVLQDGSAHGLQIVEMARHVAKLAIEVPSPTALPHLVRRAIVTAQSGRRGPVLMTLPMDISTAKVSMPKTSGSIALDALVDAALIDEIAELMIGADRPLILAGSGVRGDGAPEKLRKVAEQLGCPVATTPKGKGVFPDDHALALGVLGMGGHPSARDYVAGGLDVVIAIGTSLGDLATDGFSPKLQGSKALIHIDIDARQHGKSYAPTHAVVASAADLLGALAERLEERSVRHASSRSATLGTINRPRISSATSMRPLRHGLSYHPIPSSTKTGFIAPQDALAELQALAPTDAVYTVDSGDHFLFAVHFLRVTQPDQFLVMTGLGSMGQSIGAALGCQLADPDRFVAAICGDGCFAMAAFEIATAVQEGLPIRVLVFNDERLGMVENGHSHVYGRKASYSTTGLDVCAVARGLGAATMRVDGAGQLAAAAEFMRTTPGPVVVDVRIDPAISLPRKDRIATTAPTAVRKPDLAN